MGLFLPFAFLKGQKGKLYIGVVCTYVQCVLGVGRAIARGIKTGWAENSRIFNLKLCTRGGYMHVCMYAVRMFARMYVRMFTRMYVRSYVRMYAGTVMRLGAKIAATLHFKMASE